MTRDLLRSIDDALAGSDPLVVKRATRDLTRVQQRLLRGDYEVSAFGTNVFDIPDRATELITELEFIASIGQAWERLIRESGVASVDRVIEIGSGYAPKVQLGLFYADFQGTLLALDQDAASLRDLQRYLGLFRPRYTLTPVVGSLYDTTLAPAPAVVANHLFDDLLLDAYCVAQGVSLQNVYGDESVLRTAWSAILAAGLTTELVERVAASLARLVAPDGVLLVAQYRSYIERLLALEGVNGIAVGLMDAVARTLCATSFRPRAELVGRALHDTHFVVREADCRVLERVR